METGSLQHQYDLCSQAIEDSIEKVERLPKKDIRKDVKELIRMWKELRKEFQIETIHYNKKNNGKNKDY